MKYYKISEDQLVQLIEDSLRLTCLEWDGVDNWEWYMEGRHDFLKTILIDIDKDPKEAEEIIESGEFGFYEAALADLSFYELIGEDNE